MSITPTILNLLPMGAAPQTPVSVLLVAVPANVTGRVQGEVANIDKSGQVVIQTPRGDVIIQTDMPLKIGQTVDIKLPAQVSGSAAQTAQLMLAAAPLPHAEELAIMPPSVLLEVTEEAQSLGGLPPQIAPSLPGYQAPSAIPPAQTLFQLMGMSLPATVMPAQNLAKPTLDVAPPAMLGMNGTVAASGKTAPQTSMMAIDRVQILFLGSLEDAQIILQQNTTAISGKSAGQATAGMMNAAAQMTGPMAPVLAQLTGLTPQKLPIFETLPLPPQIPAAGQDASLFARSDRPNVVQQPGSHIVLHSPVLMTMAEERQAGPVAALLVKLPSPPLLPEELFAQNSLSHSAPLLSQLLHSPASILPGMLAAQAQDIVPRPGTPKFAMNVAMALLGLSGGDAKQMFSAKLLNALKPEQREQLDCEIRLLPGLTRDAASQNAEGLRVNLPVEMAGQMYMWQLTVRNHDQDQRQGAGGGRVDAPTRFILDLYMTQLGAMQVDGLSFNSKRHLDLILRTKEMFAAEVQEELRREAYAVFERAELSGSFEFQTL